MKKAAAAIAVAGSLATLGVYQMNVETTDLYSKVDDAVETEFQAYTAKHGKSYVTKEEYKFRLGIFARSKELIGKYNEQNNADGATLGLNAMADWTQEEYKKLLGYKPVEDTVEVPDFEEPVQEVGDEVEKKPEHHGKGGHGKHHRRPHHGGRGRHGHHGKHRPHHGGHPGGNHHQGGHHGHPEVASGQEGHHGHPEVAS